MAYKICVLRAPGTNCDIETAISVKNFGIEVERIHFKRFLEERSRFENYDGLIIPGGFSYGDHVRAGALLGKMLKEKFGQLLWDLADTGKPVLGICNGFQVLIELGLLPDLHIKGALTTNLSSKFECRWTDLLVSESPNIFSKNLNGLISLPVAHGEGRFLVDDKGLNQIKRNKQIALRYARENGSPAKGQYPENPNGSLYDIAGICNRKGNVFGLMPHPERAFNGFTKPRWTRAKDPLQGDGYRIFENMVEYIRG